MHCRPEIKFKVLRRLFSLTVEEISFKRPIFGPLGSFLWTDLLNMCYEQKRFEKQPFLKNDFHNWKIHGNVFFLLIFFFMRWTEPQCPLFLRHKNLPLFDPFVPIVWATYLTTPNITSGRQCILDCHNYQNRAATHGTAFHMCKNGVSSILTPKEFLRGALKIITSTMMGQKVGLLMGFGQAIQKVEYI